ncbi:geranylgeranylglyceryl/heptaprenylglyceryl phosphate synthase [Rapidithrix thailandica]|uniref:Geranylgeranylglyceryl phosphate synthase n=1 Tax=Rapidithrix thailandica TaxID=413964 RepID=A0AAW9S8B3_9BACT
MSFYTTLARLRQKNHKAFAVLIDPDNCDEQACQRILTLTQSCPPAAFLIGGSLLTKRNIQEVNDFFKKHSSVPTVLFPGNSLHLISSADSILFLSLISGRNPEFLIGHHVVSAPFLKQSGMEVIPTGYMLVDCGSQTTVSYMSNTTPIPYNNKDIATCTAMAGELLGLKLIYMDGGSGAVKPISSEMIRAVKQAVDLPVVLGGGVRNVEQLLACYQAGADLVVVGNAIEKNPDFIKEMAEATKKINEN